jgi:hypothetical protein
LILLAYSRRATQRHHEARLINDQLQAINDSVRGLQEVIEARALERACQPPAPAKRIAVAAVLGFALGSLYRKR